MFPGVAPEYTLNMIKRALRLLNYIAVLIT
jgi:hypothetical protein